jgi:hypothetical protein
MYFTQKELQMIITWAAYRAVQSLGIPTDDLEHDDVVTTLAENKGHFAIVSELATAYTEWYEYSFALYKNDRYGNLTSAETTKLEGLMSRRDKAKKAFLDATTP